MEIQEDIKDFSYPNREFSAISDSISDAIQYTLNGDKKHIEDDIAGDKKSTWIIDNVGDNPRTYGDLMIKNGKKLFLYLLTASLFLLT